MSVNLSTVGPDVTAVVARLGVADAEGDWLERGGLVGRECDVSGWGHEVVRYGAEPVGAARLRERAGTIVAEVIYRTDGVGRKALDDVNHFRPRWSVQLEPLRTRRPSKFERAHGAHRVVTRFRIREISPVDDPADPGTATLRVSKTLLWLLEEEPEWAPKVRLGHNLDLQDMLAFSSGGRQLPPGLRRSFAARNRVSRVRNLPVSW
jgi:hypothetical protein